jgi:ATP-binding cassette, subfamily B, bacterial PglK
MIRNFMTVLRLLNRSEKWKLAVLGLAMVGLALVEVGGVSSIAPFLAVATDPDIIETNRYLNAVYQWFDFASTRSFLIALGLGVVAFLILRNTFLALTNYGLNRYAQMRNHSLSKRMLAEYLSRPYTFFLGKNSSELNRDVLVEVNHLTKGFLIPALQVLSRVLITAALIIFLIAVNPLAALIAAVSIAVLYGGVYTLVRGQLAVLGQRRMDANRGRFQTVTEAFTGIKDVKLLGKEKAMVKQFDGPSKRKARAEAVRHLLSNVPKFALESVAISAVMIVVIYFIAVRESYQEVIPVIGIYMFAAYRLMPSLQKIFTQMATMRASDPVVRFIDSQFTGNPNVDPKDRTPAPTGTRLTVEDAIEFDSIRFRYENTELPTISNLTLRINAGTTVGLVGPTGCGKTTTVDILLGLLAPEAGRLLVDGKHLVGDTMRRWQLNLGYVPQQIFLSDNTLARNIAFGISEDKVDMRAVERAARVANLHDFVANELPEGYNTVVGERGIRLSGGQRQRVGIARAVYHDPGVLVLDEATSALDSVTESAVMDAIHNLAHDKTIIVIAHRITTVRECDNIFMLEKGRLVEEGTYDELMESSEYFRALANVGE